MRRLAPLLLLLLLVPAAAEHGDGESGAWLARLPLATSAAAVATDGRFAYVIGGYGHGDALDAVQRLDPRDAEGASLVGHLPRRLSFAAAVWMGDALFVFGGRWDGTASDAILRFDPATNRTRVMDARLPWGAEGVMAATDGEVAYLVVGNAVLLYDPAADRVTLLSIEMPANLTHGTAVWTGDRLLAFGGLLPGGVETDRILVVDPAAGTARFAEARLPSPRTHVAAAWSGTRAYVLGGGTDATPEHADVLQYDPARDELRALETRMPSARSRAAAAFVEGRVYVLGGAERNGPVLDEVWRFTPPQAHAGPPDAPQPPVARLRVEVRLLLAEVDARGSTDDGRIVEHRVDWGDGATSASATGLLAHHYPLPGTYRVRLTVVDDAGLAAHAEQDVVVDLPLPPTATPPRVESPDAPTELPLEGQGAVPALAWVSGGFAALGSGALLATRAFR